MNDEKKEYTKIAIGYNCIMLVMAIIALSMSVGLLISGRLFREGVDGTFLFAVGLVLATTFSINPLLAVREGLLRDMLELWREGSRGAIGERPSAHKAWHESPAH